MWLLKEAILTPEGRKLATLRRSLPWLGLSGFLATFCFADSFVFVDPKTGLRARGIAYIIYSVIGISAYLFFVQQAWRQMRAQTGIRRIETQFLALTIGIAALLAVAVISVGNLLDLPTLRGSSFYILFGAQLVAAWTTINYRIFAARQVFLSLAQRAILATVACLALLGLWRLHEKLQLRRLDLFLSVAVISSFAIWLDRKSRAWLDLDGERRLDEYKRGVIAIALREPNPDKLIYEFGVLLHTRWQCWSAELLFNRGETHSSPSLELRKDRLGYPVLCETRWTTPESIERRPISPPMADLREFVSEHSLGAIVTSPRASRSPSLIIALGRKTDGYPFTYPEVRLLQNIAEVMDNIITHSRLTMQAALQTRVEQLAMMSRGLAHDLKNLITPVSSFLVHSGDGLPANSPAAEVHSAATRSVRIMTDYVREALFFSERLSPHFEPVILPMLFEEVRGITATRASQRKITISTITNPDLPLTADAVLLQRMLANLVANSIDASSAGQAVVLSAAADRPGWVRLQVSDNGCGISAENLGRIFDPYFTTKEFGDDVRGFGLGLTICQKIVHLHGGKISAASQPGRGTTITVELPTCPATEPAGVTR